VIGSEMVVTGVSKTYGSGPTAMTALGDITFRVEPGEFVAIVGPSGAGKTTLLQCLAGLLPLSAGSITLGGRAITKPVPELALVFQDYSRSLFPWLTAKRNVALPLKDRGLSTSQISTLVSESLQQVGLGESGDKYPWQMSGGMQQRVAIARALAMRPRVLLMDEPFASVDAQTRADLEDLVMRVWKEHGMTVLLVTHDIDEAVYLSDRVLLLSKSPAVVTRSLDVELPRPRDQITTKEDPLFGRLRGSLFREIMQLRKQDELVETST
jgi:NitT/TauT family transport system ATP-binding protein